MGKPAQNATETSVMQSVAVIVAAYNAESTIVASVESILLGTTPCHVYVVDDCSRIPAATALSHLEDRIEIIRLDQNVGPAAARNIAIDRAINAGFEFIAIQDADDISFPTRLEKQIAFMRDHPHVGACGTWTCLLDENLTGAFSPELEAKAVAVRETKKIGNFGTWTLLFDEQSQRTVHLFSRVTDPKDVRNTMFFNIGLSHTSAVMRSEALRKVGLYSTDYPAAEDYELMRRIGTQFDLANIPECLVHYRISPGGISQSRRRRQLYDRLMIQVKYFEVTQWRAWVGAAKTLATMVIPRQLKDMIRSA
ncbi:MAG: glycosyltransferase family 2 protein [Afipia felis]|nr:glycosyltransferase family 2 protein [Afipia felis]